MGWIILKEIHPNAPSKLNHLLNIQTIDWSTDYKLQDLNHHIFIYFEQLFYSGGRGTKSKNASLILRLMLALT